MPLTFPWKPAFTYRHVRGSPLLKTEEGVQVLELWERLREAEELWLTWFRNSRHSATVARARVTLFLHNDGSRLGALLQDSFFGLSVEMDDDAPRLLDTPLYYHPGF